MEIIVDAAIDHFYDWRLGIETAKNVYFSELGYTNPSYIWYEPSLYRSIHKILRIIKAAKEDDVLLDYGCGKGRVLVVAAQYPFQKVIGVELNPELSNIARDNIQKARVKLRCKDIQVITADATSYLVPPEVNFFFFFYPFTGEIMSRVIDNIHTSLISNPRDITILFIPAFNNPLTILDNCTWLEKCREEHIFPRWWRNRIVRIYNNTRS
jgi:SAM-dependent methyltransferase